MSESLCVDFTALPLLANALHEARLDRELRRAEAQRLPGDVLRDAVELEHDAPRRDPGGPELRRSLALAHANLGRLLRHRDVREHPDPDSTLALHLARDRAASCLDLARGDAFRLERLQPELAEIEFRAALRGAADAALELLAELGLLGLQHDEALILSQALRRRLAFAFAATAGAASFFGQALVLRHRVVLEDLALEDPDLDPARPVGRKRGRGAVIDVGPQGVQRNAALAVPLHARGFGSAETARAVDADAFRAEAHGRLHGALHGAPEGDPALELLCDRFRDERRVDLGLADLDDVDRHLRRGHPADELAQLLDVGALLADDDARARGVNRHPALPVRALDHDLRHGGLLQLLHQRLADRHVLVHQLRVFALAGEPARVPGPVEAEPKTDRVDFLAHQITSRLLFGGDFANHDRQVRERFQDARATTAGAGVEALEDESLADVGLADHEIVDVEIVVVLGVGNGALEAFADVPRDPLPRELEVGKR